MAFDKRQYAKRWKDLHPEKEREYTNRSRQRKLDIVIEAMGGLKCKHCGAKESHGKSKALQFHHVDPSIRSFSITSSLNHPLKDLLEEAHKCILLCQLCHIAEHVRIRSERRLAKLERGV